MTGRVHPPSPTRWRKAAARSVASHAISAYFISPPRVEGFLQSSLPFERGRTGAPSCSFALHPIFLSRIGLIVNGSPWQRPAPHLPALLLLSCWPEGQQRNCIKKAAPVNGSALFVRLHPSRVWTAPVLARGTFVPLLLLLFLRGRGRHTAPVRQRQLRRLQHVFFPNIQPSGQCRECAGRPLQSQLTTMPGAMRFSGKLRHPFQQKPGIRTCATSRCASRMRTASAASRSAY